ncbi:MAG: shikimate dehydrogenase [Bacteroidia bacterium]|jgi:shikimate dehydrogenase|nr:shikimate dehydrogenase [Bacteroidia bacterium]
MNQYGLIGFPLTASFSAAYFKQKFEALGLIHSHAYNLFPLQNIEDINDLLQRYPTLKGLNITIPHKQSILPYIHHLDETATAIGAANCVKIEGQYPNHQITGYNTDAWGFEQSLRAWLPTAAQHKALVLGNGGSAKAVTYVLSALNIEWMQVSRTPQPNQIGYLDITESMLKAYSLIINTTPLGMHPNVNSMAPIPLQWLTAKHHVYDLVYNPTETKLLTEARLKGATILNGLHMLHLQADRSWQIWSGKL